MAAGLGLVNLVLNYENQDCSTVLAFTLYVTKAVIADTVAVNKEFHSHHKVILLLLQVEKHNPQRQSSFLALMVSS